MRRVLLIVFMLAGCGAADDGGMPTGAGGTGNVGGSGGGSDWPMVIGTTWAVRLNGGAPPSCQGLMSLSLTQQVEGATISAVGSWNCVEATADCLYVVSYIDAGWSCFSYSGPVSGQVTPLTGATTLILYTDASHSVQVTGTMTSTSIVGTAQFSNAGIAFDALLN